MAWSAAKDTELHHGIVSSKVAAEFVAITLYMSNFLTISTYEWSPEDTVVGEVSVSCADVAAWWEWCRSGSMDYSSYGRWGGTAFEELVNVDRVVGRVTEGLISRVEGDN